MEDDLSSLNVSDLKILAGMKCLCMFSDSVYGSPFINPKDFPIVVMFFVKVRRPMIVADDIVILLFKP